LIYYLQGEYNQDYRRRGLPLKNRLTIPCFLLLTLLTVPSGFCRAAGGDTSLIGNLSEFRARDDLAGWIYAQLQWTARAPARRSGVLVSAARGAWRMPHTPEEEQAWLDLLTNEGYSLLLSGSIVASTDAYVAAYDFARKHPSIADEGLVLESVLKPLGNNYTRLGDYEQALFVHRKAAALALSLGDRQALAGVYSNLANTSGNMGRSQAARDYCRKGLGVAREHTAIVGLLLSELADAYREMGKADSAKEAIRRSIAILEVAADHSSSGYWLLTAYQSAGDLYSTTETGLRWYKKAYDLQRRLSLRSGELRRRDKAKLFYRLGLYYARRRDTLSATQWLDSCLAVLEPGRSIAALQPADLYAENTLADALYWLAGLQRSADEGIRLYELSFAAERKGRQQLITSSSKEKWVADSRERYENAIGLAWDSWTRSRCRKYAATLLRFMEGSKAQLLLDESLQQQQVRSSREDSALYRTRLLEQGLAYYQKEMIGGVDSSAAGRIREIEWELAKLRKQRKPAGEIPLATDSVPGWLPGGMVIRNYFAGTNRLYMVECGREGIRYVDRQSLDSGWQHRVQGFVEHWFTGPNAIIADPAGYYRDAREVYHQFFGTHPLAADSSYILLPDGALHLLPVDALITGGAGGDPGSPASWPFVIRRTAVSYGYSLQTLREQRELSGGGEFAGFFLAANGRDLPSLRATAAERTGIMPFVQRGNWYTDSMATAAAFRRAAAVSSIIHISSHAFAGDDKLDAPHIQFYDQPFYLFELQALEIHPALVVLGACRTANGRYLSGEGAQSLARGFTAGGAAAVVAGWWNVNDEAAGRMMADFYERMATQNDSAGEINAAIALRAAKLAWLQNDSQLPVLQLPYYWAVLNYQGNPMPFGERRIDALRSAHDYPFKGFVAAPGHRARIILAFLLVLTAVALLILRRRF